MAAQGYARDVYARSAPFYDLFHSDLDYGAEAARLHRLVESRAPGARSLLDVGCGTGRHLVHLRADFEVEGLDISRTCSSLPASACRGFHFIEGIYALLTSGAGSTWSHACSLQSGMRRRKMAWPAQFVRWQHISRRADSF